MFYKKVYYNISQNSQENTCVQISFIIKLQTAILWDTVFQNMLFAERLPPTTYVIGYTT